MALVENKRTLGAVLSAVACAFAVSAADAQDIDFGQQIYTESCAACHGASGTGDGEFANYLTIKPSDLTLLTKKNHGTFPYLDVFHIIDGRTGVRGHGSKDMPIWGAVFTREIGETGSPYGSELRIRTKIVALVDHIESLQK